MSPPSSLLEQPHVAKLARKLKRHSAIRSWLAKHQSCETGGSCEDLLSELDNRRTKHWVDRAVAWCAFCHLELTPTNRDRSGWLVSRELRPIGTTFNWLNAGVSSFVLAAATVALTIVSSPKWIGQVSPSALDVGIAYFAPNLAHLWTHYLAPCVLALTITSLLTPIFIAIQYAMAGRRQAAVHRAALLAAASIGGPQCIVPLYQHIWRRTSIRQEAVEALTTILPTVDESWYGYLAGETCRALAGLAASPMEDLALASLDTLALAGNGLTVSAVERLGQRAKSTHVRKRAGEVLLILIARKEHESTSASLLRASAESQPTNLVRPVYETGVDESSLLRAAVGSQDAN